MARSGISLNADFSELAYATGAIRGMTKQVKTQRFLGDLAEYAHSRMADRFDLFMDLQLGEARDAVHHVYEWNMPAGPGSRLWQHKLLGGGAQRNATWDWRASKKPVPTPQERAMNTDDPMSLVPEDQLEFFSSRRHWFHWKAPVMESGMPVLILPVHVDNLMYPTGNPLEPLAWSKGHSVQNPGGEATTGAFTTRWVAWWSTEAPRVFDETVKPDAEVELSNAVRLTSRARRGTVGVSAMTDYDSLMRAGEDWAAANIDRYARKMRARARRLGK